MADDLDDYITNDAYEKYPGQAAKNRKRLEEEARQAGREVDNLDDYITNDAYEKYPGQAAKNRKRLEEEKRRQEELNSEHYRARLKHLAAEPKYIEEKRNEVNLDDCDEDFQQRKAAAEAAGQKVVIVRAKVANSVQGCPAAPPALPEKQTVGEMWEARKEQFRELMDVIEEKIDEKTTFKNPFE